MKKGRLALSWKLAFCWFDIGLGIALLRSKAQTESKNLRASTANPRF
jgi:hypothetical protein